MGHSRKLPSGLALTALVAGNLAFDFALWHTDGVGGFLGLLPLIAFGRVMSQALMLAVWLTCMEGAWAWRFGIPVVIMALVGYTQAAGIKTLRSEPAAMLVFPVMFQLPLLALAAFFWPFCRLRGWRFTMSAAAVGRQPGQFGLVDLIAWTTMIGGMLGLLRFHFAAGGGAGPGFVMLMAFLVLPGPVLWAVLLACFSTWPPWNWRLALWGVAIGLYWAGSLAVCAHQLYEALMTRTGLPGSTILVQSVGLCVLFFVAVPSMLALNCLALRVLGWRLV